MGFRDFWPIAKITATVQSLTSLAFKHYERNHRPYVVGIDVSGWMHSISMALANRERQSPHRTRGQNPELQAFFKSMCVLLRIPIVPVFVFDGSARPVTKRGRSTRGGQSWMVEPLREFIDAFGFIFHQAPGEAEAELAKMNELGVIDAIMTEDSDAFAFGAQCVLREFRPSSDSVSVYKADQIENTCESGLTHAGIILFAILIGGDYGEGLRNCGAKTAHALAKAGYGEKLTSTWAKFHDDPERLHQSLNAWRSEVREVLMYNHQNQLPARRVDAANAITPAFPDLTVLNCYLNPLTSWHTEVQQPVDVQFSLHRDPSIVGITRCCVHYFGWRNRGKPSIFTAFDKVLWEGCAFRLLYSRLMLFNPTTKMFATPVVNSTLAGKITTSKRANAKDLKLRRLTLTTNKFIELTGLVHGKQSQVESETVSIHVPESALRILVPALSLPKQTRNTKITEEPRTQQGTRKPKKHPSPIPLSEFIASNSSSSQAVGPSNSSGNVTEVIEVSSDSDVEVVREFVDLTTENIDLT